MDAKLLRDEADKARSEAESLKLLVTKKSDKADGLDSYGAPDRAELERKEAQQLQDAADEQEKKAHALDAMVEEAHKKARELDAKEDNVRKEYEAQLKAIDDERRSILGE